jgi:glutamine amidotransferase-like uncharacterized protein
MKTAILTGQPFATSSILPSLEQAFGRANIRPIAPGELRPSLYSGIDLLVLPGITGEKSPYPQIVPPGRQAADLRAAVEDGLIVKVECASFYWMNEHIAYTASDGTHIERDGLGWIAGTARNLGRTRASDAGFRYADTVAADIEFYAGGETIRTPVCISNGPALYLDEEERDDPAVCITARFADEAGNPVAGMTKTIGAGLLDGTAVLPHIRAAQLAGRQGDPVRESHRAALFNRIAAHEDSIAEIERRGYDLIRAHRARQLQPASFP